MAATSPQDNVSPDCAASGTPQAQTQALANPFLLTLVTREERELFEQYFLKVTICPRQSAHDWNTCVFAHVGEKGKRRDPRTFSYTGICCVSMRKDRRCVLGDACPFAHNDFEYWLHPTRYHTQLCKNGPACQRKICFFAHEPWELRVPPVRPRVPLSTAAAAAASAQQQAAGQGQPQGNPPHGSSQQWKQQQQRHLAFPAAAAAAAAAAAPQCPGPSRTQDRHSRIAHVADQVQRLLWAATNGGSLPAIAPSGSGTLPGLHTEGLLPGMGSSTSALDVAAEAEAGGPLSHLSGSGSLPDLSTGTGAFLPDNVAGASGSLPGLAGSTSVPDYASAGTGAFLPDFATGVNGSQPSLAGNGSLPDFPSVADGALQGLLGSTALSDFAAEAGAGLPGFAAAAGGSLARQGPGMGAAGAALHSTVFQSAPTTPEIASQGSSSSPIALPLQYPMQERALHGALPMHGTNFTAHPPASALGCYQTQHQHQQHQQRRQQQQSSPSPPRLQHAASRRAASEMGRSHSADTGLLKAVQALQHESPQLRQMSMPELPSPQQQQSLAPLQQKLEQWRQRQQQQQFTTSSRASSDGGFGPSMRGTGMATCLPSSPVQPTQAAGSSTYLGTGTEAMLQAMVQDLGSLPPEDLLHLTLKLQAQGQRG